MTAGLGTAAACLLSAIFVASSAAKLVDRRNTARQFRALGLAAPAAMAVVVPMIEAAIALVLVIRPAVGAALSLGLLIVFTAVLARAFRSGRSVSCSCFGSRGDEPISAGTLARNLALMTAAVVAVTTAGAGDGPTVPGAAAITTVATAALLAAVVVQSLKLRHSVGHLWVTSPAGEHGGQAADTADTAGIRSDMNRYNGAADLTGSATHNSREVIA